MRRAVSVIVTLALAGAIVATVVLRNRPDTVASVTVQLRTERGPAGGAEGKQTFASHASRRPIGTLEVDLSKWAGQLVRLDLRGALASLSGREKFPGTVGFAAHVMNAAGDRPVEFMQWRNVDPKTRLHHGTLGPASFRGPTREGQTFVTGKDGALWYVVRVQPGDRFHLSFTPIPPGDMAHPDEPYLPAPPKPWTPAKAKTSTWGRRPDVLIYLLDAMRADHSGAYGYARPTTPTIDRFAKTATVYERAYSTVSWTRASVASLITGLYPLAHGVSYLDTDRIDTWPVTLSKALGAAGYDTSFVTVNGQVSADWGFEAGYAHYAAGEPHVRGTWAVAQAKRWLEVTEPSRPVFMYLHTVDPHIPYDPTPESRRLFDRGVPGRYDGSVAAMDRAGLIHPKVTPTDVQHLIDLYDGDIHDGDTAVAQFLALLQRTGRLDNSLIIILADHGEAFTEHDTLQHGRTLNVEDLHIPLIIHYPQGRYAGVRVKDPVSMVDLYTTIMQVSDVRPSVSYGLPGLDLAQLAADPTPRPRRPMFAELSSHQGDHLDLVSVLDEDGYRRVIDLSLPPRRAARKSVGLWNTKADPTEQVNLSGKRPLREAYDEQLLAQYLTTQRWWRGPASTGTTATTPMTEKMREHLRALGYLN